MVKDTVIDVAGATGSAAAISIPFIETLTSIGQFLGVFLGVALAVLSIIHKYKQIKEIQLPHHEKKAAKELEK